MDTKNSESQNQSVNDYKEIVNFSKEEINNVRGYYKWAISIIIGSITIIIALGVFITYGSFSELREDIREIKISAKDEINNMMNESSEDFNSLSKRLITIANFHSDSIRIEVKNRIDNEFDRKNIHELVELKARERIDEIADAIIEDKINKKILPLENRINRTALKVVEIADLLQPSLPILVRQKNKQNS